MSKKLIALFASSPEFVALAAARPLSLPSEAGASLPSEICWMPTGTHEINCFDGAGRPTEAKVLCDEAGARLIAASFASILAKGQRVYFDKDHKDEEATAWVTGFSWDPSQGIMARVEWTSLGQELLRGKV
jgi:phage I-like protein